MKCHICGRDMQIKNIYSGERKGISFYVCKEWPHCEGRKPYAEETKADETKKTKETITIEKLNELEWFRFEKLCSEFLKQFDFEVKTTTFGPDGGVDIIVHKKGKDEPFGVVQCKAWHTRNVGERYIRDLMGVMAKNNYKCGMFMTTGEYTKAAKDFANNTKITLLTGEMLVNRINSLPEETRNRLIEEAFEGDYKTPTCPKCGIKMVQREAKRGKNAGDIFWGCENYPKCRQTLINKPKEN